MSIALIRDRLATYDCTSEIEEEQAVKIVNKPTQKAKAVK